MLQATKAAQVCPQHKSIFACFVSIFGVQLLLPVLICGLWRPNVAADGAEGSGRVRARVRATDRVSQFVSKPHRRLPRDLLSLYSGDSSQCQGVSLREICESKNSCMYMYECMYIHACVHELFSC